MLRLLSRHLLGELARVGLLTTGVLVTLIAFGATIKPLANNDLLTVAQTLKYIGLAMVPMLQFALPFASGFAATLVLHRFATDNEIVAMATSGLSYRRIFAPVLGCGMVLLIVMLVLMHSIIPRFWSMLQRTVTADVTQLFAASIKAGTPFELDDIQIYADTLITEAEPPDTGADRRLRLVKVAAVELDADRRVVTDITAKQAVIDIYRRDGQTLLKLIMSDTVMYNRDTGQLAATPEIVPNRAIAVPDLFRDDPRFMTRGELLEARRNPDRFGPVQQLRRELADAMREAETWDAIDAALRETGRATFVEATPAARTYVVEAGRLRAGAFMRRDASPVRITQIGPDGPLRIIEADSVEIAVREIPTARDEIAFDFVLLNYRITETSVDGATNVRARKVIPNLRSEFAPSSDLADLGTAELLERADAAPALRGRTEGRAAALRSRIDELLRDTRGRLWKRYALAATAPLLLMLGAILAVWRRESLPLTIYFLAFAPSISDILLISGGEQMVRHGSVVTGAMVMWSGNAIMFGLIVFAFLRLRRN